jgi:hypothetical protein
VEASIRTVWLALQTSPDEIVQGQLVPISMQEQRSTATVNRDTFSDMAQSLRNWTPAITEKHPEADVKELVASYVDYLDSLVNSLTTSSMVDYAWAATACGHGGFWNEATQSFGAYKPMYLVWALLFSFGLRSTSSSIYNKTNAISTSMRMCLKMLPPIAMGFMDYLVL